MLTGRSNNELADMDKPSETTHISLNGHPTSSEAQYPPLWDSSRRAEDSCKCHSALAQRSTSCQKVLPNHSKHVKWPARYIALIIALSSIRLWIAPFSARGSMAGAKKVILVLLQLPQIFRPRISLIGCRCAKSASWGYYMKLTVPSEQQRRKRECIRNDIGFSFMLAI
jgi:hypothetical protein